MNQVYAYGQWPLVVGMIVIAVFFITKHIPLKTRFEKRKGGVLYAFIIALFAVSVAITAGGIIISDFVVFSRREEVVLDCLY